MNKIVVIFLTMFFFAWSNFSYAAGTVTVIGIECSPYLYTIEFVCVGDDSDGSIPDINTDDYYLATGSLPVDNVGMKVTDFIKGRWLDQGTADPGTTTPDADGNIYLINAAGRDLLDGNGVDMLSDTDTLGFIPATDGTEKQQGISGALIFRVTEQTAVDATYSVKFDLDR